MNYKLKKERKSKIMCRRNIETRRLHLFRMRVIDCGQGYKIHFMHKHFLCLRMNLVYFNLFLGAFINVIFNPQLNID